MIAWAAVWPALALCLVLVLLGAGLAPLPGSHRLRVEAWADWIRALFGRSRRAGADGLTIPFDPPPQHWNCRCVVHPVDQVLPPDLVSCVLGLTEAWQREADAIGGDWERGATRYDDALEATMLDLCARELRASVEFLSAANHDEEPPMSKTKTAHFSEVRDIALIPVESSQLEARGYDPETQTLAIRFKGHGGKPGGLYHYADFSADDWKAFTEAPSAGSHFIRQIKPHALRYPCTRIIETPAN